MPSRLRTIHRDDHFFISGQTWVWRVALARYISPPRLSVALIGASSVNRRTQQHTNLRSVEINTSRAHTHHRSGPSRPSLCFGKSRLCLSLSPLFRSEPKSCALENSSRSADDSDKGSEAVSLDCEAGGAEVESRLRAAAVGEIKRFIALCGTA